MSEKPKLKNSTAPSEAAMSTMHNAVKMSTMHNAVKMALMRTMQTPWPN